MKKYSLEICVDSVESALAAYRGGASRLELCSNLVIGGTSPDTALFQLIREQMEIPVHALIRPRFGDFLYTDSEYELMRRQIDALVKAGVNGIVIGSLNADGSLNEKQMKGLIEAAAGCRITLHRAFDVCKDPFETMEIAKQLGVSLILTSGQEKNCWEGREMLKRLTEKAGSEITIMAGAGVSADNLEELCREVHTTDYHMSAKETLDSGMVYRNEKVYMGLPGISEFEVWRTGEEAVRKSVEILNRMELSGERV